MLRELVLRCVPVSEEWLEIVQRRNGWPACGCVSVVCDRNVVELEIPTFQQVFNHSWGDWGNGRKIGLVGQIVHDFLTCGWDVGSGVCTTLEDTEKDWAEAVKLALWRSVFNLGLDHGFEEFSFQHRVAHVCLSKVGAAKRLTIEVQKQVQRHEREVPTHDVDERAHDAFACSLLDDVGELFGALGGDRRLKLYSQMVSFEANFGGNRDHQFWLWGV